MVPTGQPGQHQAARENMPIPVPSGGDTSTLQNEAFYQGLLHQEFGAAAATEYASLYSQLQSKVPPTSTESTAYQIFNPFAAALATGMGVSQAGQAVASGIAGVTQTTGSALPSISSPFGALFQKNLWIRVAEVVIGLILMGIGLNSMLKGKPLTVITAPAGALGKAVPR